MPANWHPAVLTWGDRTRRDLPWRATRDPWAVLVAEVMLQQTQVPRVIPKYLEFLAEFPTPRRCAQAPVSSVIAAWTGLGYNRRAVNLHAAACTIMHRFGGSVPDRFSDLIELPGVGRYTARAVLAFAFESRVGVVDTNIARVFARVKGRRLGAAEVQALADDAVPVGDSWAWNQSLMDLGATLCTARSPSCGECPLRSSCRWRGRGVDPAAGSAGVSARQSRFEGSDRQGRGRLLRALQRGSVESGAELALAMGWPEDPQRAARVAATLVADGLAVNAGTRYQLP